MNERSEQTFFSRQGAEPLDISVEQLHEGFLPRLSNRKNQVIGLDSQEVEKKRSRLNNGLFYC